MPANPPKRPRWKSNILHSAIAAVCANGLFAPQAQATCGPTVSVSQGQCIFSSAEDTVVNEGVTISTTDGSDAMLYQYFEGGPGSLTNNGIISATASGEDAITHGISIESSYGDTITNNGQISASVDGFGNTHVEGIFIDFFSGTLNNHGSISAHASNETNAAGFGAGTVDRAELHNHGTIQGASDGINPGWSLNIEGGEDSIVNNEANGVLRGRISMSGSNQTLNNDGLIDLNTVDTIGEVSGSFNQSASGTLRITAEGAGEDDHSWIQISGTANISGKAFVDVEEVNTLAVGQTMENVLLANQLNGNFAEVNDNSALFNFVSVATEGSNGRIDFEITKGMTALESVITSGNPTGEGGAEVLDEIIEEGTSDPGMQKVIDALGRLGSEQQVSDAVSQTLPLITGNSAIASSSTLSGIRRVIQARIEAHKGISYGDSHVAADNELWIKPFGSRVDQDDRDGVSGFEGRTSGLVFGVDGMRSEETRLGISFAYAQANIDGNSTAAPNSAEVDIYQLLGYGTHDLGEGRELSFQAGVGQNKTKGERDILFLNETAKANYNSLSATAGIGLAEVSTNMK